MNNSSTEYEMGGVKDPFLQVKILELFGYIGHNNEESTEEMADILAHIATNTEPSKIQTDNQIIKEAPEPVEETVNHLIKELAAECEAEFNECDNKGDMVQKSSDICDKEAEGMVERFVINPKPIKSRKRKKASKSQERLPKKKRTSLAKPGMVTNSNLFL